MLNLKFLSRPKWIIVLFGIGIVINFAGEKYADYILEAFLQANDRVIIDLQFRNTIERIRSEIVLVESKTRGLVITENKGIHNEIRLHIENVEENFGKISNALKEDPVLKILGDSLGQLLRNKIEFNKNIVQTFHHEGALKAKELIETGMGKIYAEKIFAVCHRIDSSKWTNALAQWREIQNQKIEASFINSVMPYFGSCLFIVFGFFVTRQIAINHQMYEELKAASEKEKNAYLVKDQFISNMSHEVRTPLNSIIGYSSLLKKTELSESQKPIVEAIHISGDNLLRIVNDLLDFSKLETGTLTLEKNNFNVHELGHQLSELFNGAFTTKNISFSVFIDPDIPHQVVADEIKLRQILVNLISNALKFTDSGSVTLNVRTLLSSPNQVTLQFVVQDTGCGISSEHLSRIFERFYQAHGGLTRKHQGTGLGLAITKQLVEIMGGRINVKSEPDKGTEFTIEIPFTTDDQKTKALLTTAENVEPEKQTQDLKKQILVVDDNQLNRDLVTLTLRVWNFSSVAVSTGREALDLLQTQGGFDLVLLDIQMPEMDGYTVAKKIRQELRNDIPIIALTAHSDKAKREKCLRAGMNHYLSKPFNELELFGLIVLLTNDSRKNNFVDLQYLKSLSKGNQEFEQRVVSQFANQVPVQLSNLETALLSNNMSQIKKILHDLQSNVAVVGLQYKLEEHFTVIKTSDVEFEKETALHSFSIISAICNQAIEQIKSLYP